MQMCFSLASLESLGHNKGLYFIRRHASQEERSRETIGKGVIYLVAGLRNS